MVMTKDELIAALQHEVRILLHLASKIEPAMLDYRPSPKQRSMLELLQYLTIMAPIHLSGALAETFSMDAWGAAWNSSEATAKRMNLAQVKDGIGQQAALVAERIGPLSEEELEAPIEMFGRTASRGATIVSLVLNHYAAYRMQLFLYLKACGREELGTMNLWVGIDG